MMFKNKLKMEENQLKNKLIQLCKLKIKKAKIKFQGKEDFRQAQSHTKITLQDNQSLLALILMVSMVL